MCNNSDNPFHLKFIFHIEHKHTFSLNNKNSGGAGGVCVWGGVVAGFASSYYYPTLLSNMNHLLLKI